MSNAIDQSTSGPTLISMGRLIRKLQTTYYPAGAAVHIEGSPGNGKSSMALDWSRIMQDMDAELGVSYLNGSNAQSIHLEGYPMQNGFLSASTVPLLFQPKPELGLRGAFPALCPTALVHKSAKVKPVALDVAYSTALNRTQLTTYPRNIVVLDEFTKLRTPDDMATGAMLAYEGRTGQWGVDPANSLRLFIANRAQDQSRDMQPPATYYDRVAWYEVYLAFADVAPHWQKKGMLQVFIDFAGAHTDLVMARKVPSGKVQFSTARSFEQAHKECVAYCKNELQYDPADGLPIFAPETQDQEEQTWMADFLNIISARCGDAVRGAFQSFYLALDQLVNYDDIARDPMGTFIPTHAGVTNALLNNIVANADLRDLKAIGTYVCRSEFPPSLAKTLCVRLTNKFPRVALAANADFMNLCNRLGVGATMGFRH